MYDRVKQPVSEPAKSDAVDTSPPGHSPASANSRTDHSRVSPVPAEYAESRDRRLLELRLLNHFVSVAGPTLGADQHASEALTNLGPNLAMSNDALLYGILAVSAFHASHCDPGNPEYVDAYRLYYGLAIVEHRKDVAKGITRENSDVLILTSTFLRVATMVELQERSMDPYEPPFRVLQIIHAAGTVFKEAYQLWKDEEDSLVVRFVKGVPVAAGGEDWYLPEYRLSLLHLLRRMPADEEQEAWDDEIKETYEKTLSGKSDQTHSRLEMADKFSTRPYDVTLPLGRDSSQHVSPSSRLAHDDTNGISTAASEPTTTSNGDSCPLLCIIVNFRTTMVGWWMWKTRSPCYSRSSSTSVVGADGLAVGDLESTYCFQEQWQ